MYNFNEVVGEPCRNRTCNLLIKSRQMGINDFNKLSERLTQSVMTVNAVNPIFSIKSGKIVGRKDIGRGGENILHP